MNVTKFICEEPSKHKEYYTNEDYPMELEGFLNLLKYDNPENYNSISWKAYYKDNLVASG